MNRAIVYYSQHADEFYILEWPCLYYEPIGSVAHFDEKLTNIKSVKRSFSKWNLIFIGYL